jgi:hypothetical protein
MTQRAGRDLRVVAEPQLNLSDNLYVVPDILAYSGAIKVPDVRPRQRPVSPPPCAISAAAERILFAVCHRQAR